MSSNVDAVEIVRSSGKPIRHGINRGEREGLTSGERERLRELGADLADERWVTLPVTQTHHFVEQSGSPKVGVVGQPLTNIRLEGIERIRVGGGGPPMFRHRAPSSVVLGSIPYRMHHRLASTTEAAWAIHRGLAPGHRSGAANEGKITRT